MSELIPEGTLPAAYASSVEVFEHPKKGRCLRSRVQLQPGSVVLREVAIATAPDLSVSDVDKRVVHFQASACFHCSGPIAGGCPWPCEEGCDYSFCSPQCYARLGHVHRAECPHVENIESLGLRKGVDAWRLLLAARATAACSEDPQQAKVVEALGSYCAVLVADAGGLLPTYMSIEEAAANPNFTPADEGFDACEPCSVQAEMLCRVLMNSLPLPGPGGPTVMALLAATSLCSHSCRPNCHVAHEGAGTVALRAVSPISPGEELTISYLDDLGAFGEVRRAELLRTRYFKCVCERCTSAEEISGWDAAAPERKETLVAKVHAVVEERDMESLADLLALVHRSSDAVACEAGRCIWRTLRLQFHVEDELLELFSVLAPLLEAGLPAHHPIKAQLYLEFARGLALGGRGAEPEFLHALSAAQSNIDICFGADSAEAEKMKKELAEGQTDEQLRMAPT
ncbi:unnamed protein product [Polarella glacialis]|uniref:SET domain-containing protein n=1 Tax=Polarella glacialis TaxID=89957 RepID=A0A813DTC2_POLGL|nr:unnamed protein product [Polarella glacialis]